MENIKDYSNLKNSTAIKAQVRIDVMKVVVNALKEYYGEDSVLQVGSNEYVVSAGTTRNSKGLTVDVPVTLKPTVKEWEDRKTAKKEYLKYDMLHESKEYFNKVQEDKEKAEQNKKKKAEKIARDQADRAKKKEI